MKEASALCLLSNKIISEHYCRAAMDQLMVQIFASDPANSIIKL